MRGRVALALLFIARPVSAQDLARRVAAAPDGQVRFSYAARPGIYGNGRGIISWDCRNGRCRSRQVQDNDDDAAGDAWRTACDSGLARVVLTVRHGAVASLRVHVGGAWRPSAGVTDFGAVSARDAARFLLELAARSDPRAGRDAVFAAMLADSVPVWPDLLTLARNAAVPDETRRSAVFWLAQAAGAAVTQGLSDLVDDDGLEVGVKKSAVFAISQLPHEEGVPVLVRVARTHPNPEIRRSALFWLGQTNDPRALAVFEELLTKP